MSYKQYIDGIAIPTYTEKQEAFNTLSHMFGVPFAIAIGLFGALEFANGHISLFHFLGLLIFAISAVGVYLVSFLYHGTPKTSYRKKLLRILDHSTIYLLIAGTYTPICFVLLETNIIGLIMLLIEWIGAVIGITLNVFLFQKRWALIVSFILYIVMGWLCLFLGGFLYMPVLSFTFILAGGIVYTIGSVLFALGYKNKNFHCVFHVFVLLGTIVQTIGVFLIV